MTGGDEATLAFYSREAKAYAQYVSNEADNPQLTRFASMVPPGGRVLDFGCGSGWAGARFADLGFDVQGFDGSEGLADEARRRYGLTVTIGRFESFLPDGTFDGIWASFCLLHDTRAAMAGHLKRLAGALLPGGALYIGLKEGEGEQRDSLGRLYTYFSEPEMCGLLSAAGFTSIEAATEPSKGYDGAPATSLHLFARRA